MRRVSPPQLYSGRSYLLREFSHVVARLLNVGARRSVVAPRLCPQPRQLSSGVRSQHAARPQQTRGSDASHGGSSLLAAIQWRNAFTSRVRIAPSSQGAKSSPPPALLRHHAIRRPRANWNRTPACSPVPRAVGFPCHAACGRSVRSAVTRSTSLGRCTTGVSAADSWQPTRRGYREAAGDRKLAPADPAHAGRDGAPSALASTPGTALAGRPSPPPRRPSS